MGTFKNGTGASEWALRKKKGREGEAVMGREWRQREAGGDRA